MNITWIKGLLFVLLLFVAFIPRGVEAVSGNYLFGFDQGRDYLAVKQIVVDKKLTLIGAEVGGRGGFFQGPGWYYLLSIPFVLFAGDPYGASALMVSLGVGAVGLSFFLAQKMFDLKTAFFIAFFVAISPAVIAQSRFFWAPFPVSLLSVLYFYSLFQIFHKRENNLMFLAFVVGLMFHFEIATGITLFLLTSITTLLLLFKKFISLHVLVLSLAAFLFTLSPLILFDVRHNFLMTRGVLQSFGTQRELVQASHPPSLTFLIENHLSVFKANFLSAFPFSEKFYLIFVFILLAGAIYLISNKKYETGKKLFVFYLLLLPFSLFFIFMLYREPMWEWWLLELIIGYIFLLGIIFGVFWQKPKMRVFILLFLIILFTGYLKDTERFYKNDFYDFGGIHKVKGKIEAIDYIYKDAKGEKFGLLVFSPPVYTYPYDYLLWWYGNKQYGYTPPKEKKGTFYLLIEKDPAKPWSYKGWLETVIKTGKTVETKELPSGFIIEKRIEEEHAI